MFFYIQISYDNLFKISCSNKAIISPRFYVIILLIKVLHVVSYADSQRKRQSKIRLYPRQNNHIKVYDPTFSFLPQCNNIAYSRNNLSRAYFCTLRSNLQSLYYRNRKWLFVFIS